MRKVMLLAAMLAMVLAAAAPALSQTAAGGDVAILQYSCDQIQAAVNTQVQQGAGTGAVAGAAESLGVDQQQVLACFGTAAALQDSTIAVDLDGDGTADAKKGTAKAKKGTAHAKKGTAMAKSAAGGGGGGGGGGAAGGGGGGSAAAGAGGALPPTGGAPLIALGAGALLVGGGLLARRIIR